MGSSTKDYSQLTFSSIYSHTDVFADPLGPPWPLSGPNAMDRIVLESMYNFTSFMTMPQARQLDALGRHRTKRWTKCALPAPELRGAQHPQSASEYGGGSFHPASELLYACCSGPLAPCRRCWCALRCPRTESSGVDDFLIRFLADAACRAVYRFMGRSDRHSLSLFP